MHICLLSLIGIELHFNKHLESVKNCISEFIEKATQNHRNIKKNSNNKMFFLLFYYNLSIQSLELNLLI